MWKPCHPPGKSIRDIGVRKLHVVLHDEFREDLLYEVRGVCSCWTGHIYISVSILPNTSLPHPFSHPNMLREPEGTGGGNIPSMINTSAKHEFLTRMRESAFTRPLFIASLGNEAETFECQRVIRAVLRIGVEFHGGDREPGSRGEVGAVGARVGCEDFAEHA